jgi:hypothetical protein
MFTHDVMDIWRPDPIANTMMKCYQDFIVLIYSLRLGSGMLPWGRSSYFLPTLRAYSIEFWRKELLL